MSLATGLKALEEKHYADAVRILEEDCQNAPSAAVLVKIQMALVKAYQRNKQTSEAIILCQELTLHVNPKISSWAKQALAKLQAKPGKDLQQLLETGMKAYQEKKYLEAIKSLEAFCLHSNANSADIAQVQIKLVKAYQKTQQRDRAISLCQNLSKSDDSLIREWAQANLPLLQKTQESAIPTVESQIPDPVKKAGRVAQIGVKVAMKGIAGSLALASSVTIALLFGMVFVLCLSLVFIIESDYPSIGLIVSIALTLVFNLGLFFCSPWIMDLIQGWLYGTKWIDSSELYRYSPEAVEVIKRVCSERNLKTPRLGLIDDNNPTAFTYGSLPNTARLVVSKGLFTYLDDDEIATVYAHELGHIVHWDFAIMTLAGTLVQTTYLIYTFARNLGRSGGDKVRAVTQNAAIAAYIFYIIGTYLVLYLSRTREYHADHFAAETTGNPNGLSRALVKIAYGLVEEGSKTTEPSPVIEGTRALGIADYKAAFSSGTAYRIASDPKKVGRVFLWDMFNPWGGWMELHSTHPLTGKRVRALSTYAEQLGLEMEFDFAAVVREGKSLNRKKLYGNFFTDFFIYIANWLGLFIGVILGIFLAPDFAGFVSCTLLGFGIGSLGKLFIMYPEFKGVPTTDILTLMSDPYSSPLRGRWVQLDGKLIGRGDAGYKAGSDLKLQDATGMVYTRYTSRFGAIGNFFFGLTQVESLIGSEVKAVGWFRRGIMPWFDLFRLETEGRTVNSYHRFQLLCFSIGAIIIGLILPVLF